MRNAHECARAHGPVLRGRIPKRFLEHFERARGTNPALSGVTEQLMENTSEQISGTILVVDDDEGVRNVLSRWVADMGYAVKTAADADTALEIMRECPIDVALCDVRMPGHDGIWLLDQACRLCPEIALVLATGLTEMDPMVTLRPGVVGYIVKPFNRDDLAKVIVRGMAERKRLQAEHRSQPPRMLSAGMLEGFVISRG